MSGRVDDVQDMIPEHKTINDIKNAVLEKVLYRVWKTLYKKSAVKNKQLWLLKALMSKTKQKNAFK